MGCSLDGDDEYGVGDMISLLLFLLLLSDCSNDVVASLLLL